MRYLLAALIGVLLTGVESQAQLNVWSISCTNAPGSTVAADSVANLKKLDVNAPGVADAVGKCDAKLQSLQQQEQKDWDQALAARNAGDCTTARRDMDAIVSKRGHLYQVKARDELGRLGTCTDKSTPGTSASSTDSSELEKARGAFRAGNFAQARAFASPLLGRPGSVGDEAKKLIAKIDDTDETNRFYGDLVSSIIRKDFTKACQLIFKLETKDPAPKDLPEQKRKAGGCPAAAIVQADPVKIADSATKPTTPRSRGNRTRLKRALPSNGSVN